MSRTNDLRRTLLILQTLARARLVDALAASVDEFLGELAQVGGLPEKEETLSNRVEAWLAHASGTLLVRVDALLADERADGHAVREVLRATWSAWTDRLGGPGVELARIGRLLSASLARGDARGTRSATLAARAWWQSHQGAVAVCLKRALLRPP